VALSTFVGREDECRRLAELLAAHRLVTVVGPGGMGKTRLADEVAPGLAARFPGGVRRCELAQVAADRDAAIELAGTLGFSSLESLIVSLQDAPSLLVLDNCEHLLAAVARLCERLLAAAPPLRLLATSREPLAVDGEEVLVLGPLALPAGDDPASLASASATRLFDDRARAAGARRAADPTELAARAELCRRLDGVPLAIELAAARARALTAVELLALLDRRFDLLQRDAPVGRARHRSLRAAIGTSYTLLEPADQAFFRALGVFTAPFSAQLAHEVAAPPGADRLHAIDVLSRLVDRSLLVAEASGGVTRYRLLESLRDYAAEHARAAGEWEALLDRFVAAMVGEADRLVAAGLTRWSSEVLTGVLAQHDALVAAIDRAIAADADARRAFRLLLPLWGAVHQGRASEVAAAAGRVLERWPTGDEPLRAEAIGVAATALLVAGDLAAAADLARAAVATPSPIAQVIGQRALGIIAGIADPETAVACFRAGAAAAAACGLAAFERELLVFAAATPCDRDAIDAVQARLAQAAADAVAAQDPIARVWVQVVAAHQSLRALRLDAARAALTEARRSLEGLAYPYGTKVTQRLEATLLALEQGWAAARPAWRATIDRCAAAGDLAELAVALCDAAELAGRAGDKTARRTLLAARPSGRHAEVLGCVLAAEPGPAAGGAAPVPLADVRAVLDAPLPAAAPGAAPPGVAAMPRAVGIFRRDGEVWTLEFAGRRAQVRHLKGLDDLASLLARPEHEVHCLELMGGGEVDGDRGPALDARARRDYQARIRELQTDVDAARDANDLGRAERAEAELDALVEQLSAAFGLGGRTRQSGSAAERARSAVAWRVRAAIKRIAAQHPELGRHLDNAVRTGVWCSYRPEAPVEWTIAGAAGADQPRSS
jgi:predicted ATPase